MPKGGYVREKKGPNDRNRNKVKECMYCGKDVQVRAKNSRAICLNWICQDKERLRASEVAREKYRLRKEA